MIAQPLGTRRVGSRTCIQYDNMHLRRAREKIAFLIPKFVGKRRSYGRSETSETGSLEGRTCKGDSVAMGEYGLLGVIFAVF